VYCFEGLGVDARVYPQPNDLGNGSINLPPEGNTPDPSIEKMIYYRIESIITISYYN
jgi:hypothetical protein